MEEYHGFDPVAWNFYSYIESEGRQAATNFLKYLHKRCEEECWKGERAA